MKKKLCLLFIVLILGFGVSLHSNPINICASAEVTEVDGIKEQIVNIWNTQIMPLLAGLSVTTVAGFLYAFFNSRKNSKTLIKYQTMIKDVSSKCVELSNYITDLTELIKESNGIFQTTKLETITLGNKLMKNVDTMIHDVNSLENTKQILSAMSSIITKIALTSKEVIKSGVGEDITKLDNYIKKL